MKRWLTCAAAAALSWAPVASAGAQSPVSGLYIGLGAGITDLQDQNISSVRTAPGPLGPAVVGGVTSLRSLTGVAAVGSVGYGLGNGVRFELEGSFRRNQIHRYLGDPTRNPESVNGANQTYAVMANALYDFDLNRWFGIGWITPYAGVGLGYGFENLHHLRISSQNPLQPYTAVSNDTQGSFAFQAMLGFAVPIAAVPGLAFTAEYRFFGVYGHTDFRGSIASSAPLPAGVTQGSVRLDYVYNHAAMFGVRYAFNAAPPPSSPLPLPPLVGAAVRTYLVFFDWGRADLTGRAQQIIAEAAQAATRVQVTRIEVAGHADRSGAPRYNQGLSVRRAQNVASELVRLGVPGAAISVQGFGDTRPLAPTAAGVREPQNRRVEIVFR